MSKEHMTLDAGTKKFRLGIFTPDFSQPISLMRVLGPFAAMAKEDPRLELVFPQRAIVDGKEVWKIGWDWLCQCDAVFYSHPQSDVDVSTLWLAQQMGVPVWSEYVDDIFSVEPTNPHYQQVKDTDEVRERVTSAIALSAIVTSVSEWCRQAYPMPEKIAVIPEACLWPANQMPRRKCVSWRGLGSHDKDTDSVLEQLCAVAKDFPDWEWCLLGAPTKRLVKALEAAAGKDANGESQVKVAPFFSTPWHAITAWGYRAPYLHLVPLADTAFNRGKSHLAYLECASIGAGVIAPEYLPEWLQPGVTTYQDGKVMYEGKPTFEAVLRREMLTWKQTGEVKGEPVGDFHPSVQTIRQTVYPGRTERSVNQLRWRILRKLAAHTQRRAEALVEVVQN